MSNWLIAADLHIDDYPQFNYTSRSRLNQFLTLADRLVELGKENDCNTLVLAGDTVNRPTNRPYVVNVVNEVLKKLSDNFEQVYYIFGQHDMDSKSNVLNEEDTIMTALKYPNFKYMDHQILTMPSGKRIGFKDWTPVQDLSWIDEPVDILIAHYTKSDMFGQEIDESKFRVMLHGDIHNSQEIGKFISIGNPIQHNMSSQATGTCLVLNPDTCEWHRIKVDPSKSRFLRIDYVKDASAEGFEGPLLYHIYKPATLKTKTESQVAVEWNEVEELIADMVQKEKLTSVHVDVLGHNPEVHEIDFNFKLKKLKIHGYRSIEDLELNFTGQDRVILVGNNGSGKSSIVKALKAVFENSRYIRNEQSDFTEDLLVQLEFLYQNKMYHVWKGSDDWGIEIDSERLNYNNKTEFENDLLIKLPFLSYIDLFFITSNVNNLSSQFTPDRRIELLSKFYRLDRIEAYSNTAQMLYNEDNAKLQGRRDELNRITGTLDSYNRRLEELSEYKDKQESDYKSVIDELDALQDKAQKYQKWENDLRIGEGKLNLLDQSLSEYRKRMSINVDEANEEIAKAKDTQSKIQAKIDELQKKGSRLSTLKRDEDRLVKEGKHLREELDSLKNGVCPTCGSHVCNEHTKKKEDDLTEKINKLRDDYMKVHGELSQYQPEELQPNFYVDALSKLRSALNDQTQNIVMYSNKVEQYKIAKQDYDKTQEQYDELYKQLSIHKASQPEHIVLPVDYQDRYSKAMSNYHKFKEYLDMVSNVTRTQLEIDAIKFDMSEIQSKLDDYVKYIALTNRTGGIMKMILEKMAESFSDNSIKYEVNAGVFRNKPYITFNAFFKVKNKWRVYETLSDGQKTVSDIDFLNKLFSSQIGLLVMDESLRHLDFTNAPLVWDVIMKMNVNTILISTHDANFSNYTNKIILELSPEGKTKATIV